MRPPFLASSTTQTNLPTPAHPALVQDLVRRVVHKSKLIDLHGLLNVPLCFVKHPLEDTCAWACSLCIIPTIILSPRHIMTHMLLHAASEGTILSSSQPAGLLLLLLLQGGCLHGTVLSRWPCAKPGPSLKSITNLRPSASCKQPLPLPAVPPRTCSLRVRELSGKRSEMILTIDAANSVAPESSAAIATCSYTSHTG